MVVIAAIAIVSFAAADVMSTSILGVIAIVTAIFSITTNGFNATARVQSIITMLRSSTIGSIGAETPIVIRAVIVHIHNILTAP
jgi:hypothetical protein